MYIYIIMDKPNTPSLTPIQRYQKSEKGKVALRRAKAKYRHKNRDRTAEYNRQYYIKNKQKVNEHNLEYYRQNRDKINEKRRARYRMVSDK